MYFRKKLLSALMVSCLTLSYGANAEKIKSNVSMCIENTEKSQNFHIEDYKDKIEKLLNDDTKKTIEEFKSEPQKEVVYTSFDGDDMNHMLEICQKVLDENKIPVNPEMALGYYISTNTLGGSKKCRV